MRRSDREVTGLKDIAAIMEKCDVCRIALNNDGFPYIIPLNFGMEIKGDTVVLYFHGADGGTKYDLMEKDGRASFEMDCAHRLVTDDEHGSCTMEYESVAGQGRLALLLNEEKHRALQLLMEHYGREDFPINQAVMSRTRVFALTVEKMTGKRRKKKA